VGAAVVVVVVAVEAVVVDFGRLDPLLVRRHHRLTNGKIRLGTVAAPIPRSSPTTPPRLPSKVLPELDNTLNSEMNATKPIQEAGHTIISSLAVTEADKMMDVLLD